MDKKKLQKQIASKLPKDAGIVSQRIKPKHEDGGANIEAKLMEKIVLLNYFYLRLFGHSKDLLMGKDYTKLIDNPKPEIKNIDTRDFTEDDWAEYTERWNSGIKEIITLEKECEYILSLLEKLGNVTYLAEGVSYLNDDDNPSSYEDDEFAHTETIGRWRFDRKKVDSKKSLRHG
jgi:hypothetical protein